MQQKSSYLEFPEMSARHTDARPIELPQFLSSYTLRYGEFPGRRA